MQSASFDIAPIDEKPLWLKHVINSPKCKYGVKLTSAILLYGYRNKLPLIDVCRTRHDVNNRVDNYLNLSTGEWIMNTSRMPHVVTICKELLDVIISGKGDTWIYGDGSNKTNNLVIAFKTLYGLSYIEVCRQLKPKPKLAAPEPELEIVVPIVKVEVEPIPVIQSKSTVRSDVYDWSYFDREISDAIHIKRVKNLMEKTFSKSDVFPHSLVDCPEGITKVMSTIKKHDSLNTQLNVVNSLCKFLERTMAAHYSDFTFIRDEISLDLKKVNSERIIFNYQDILAKLESVCTQSNNRDLKVMTKLLLCIADFQNNSCGALRYSDVANTRITDDGEHHFLDLNNRVWILRKNYTKNKTDRIARVSDEWCSFIRELHFEPDESLIYSRTDALSKRFKKQMGVNYTDARASFVTYLDSVCDDVEMIEIICTNQGHKLQTALESYRRSKQVPVEEQ